MRAASPPAAEELAGCEDRKSTRLNSSHDQISYAVFCLKKKKDDARCISERMSRLLNHSHYRKSAFYIRSKAANLEVESPLHALTSPSAATRTPSQILSAATARRLNTQPARLLAHTVRHTTIVRPRGKLSLSFGDATTPFPFSSRRLRIVTCLSKFCFFFFNDRAPPDFSPFPLPAAFPI